MNEHAAFDADPTGLSDVRDGLERELTRRWVKTAREVRRAILQHDALGIGDKAAQLAMPTADKAHQFRRWLDEKLVSGVAGYDGSWLEPHLDQASKRGVGRVVVGDAGFDPGQPRDDSGKWAGGGGMGEGAAGYSRSAEARSDFHPDAGKPVGSEARDYVLAHGRETKSEYMVALDAGGQPIEVLGGDEHSVGFTPKMDMVADDPAGGMVVHHNHPNSSSLSSMDIAQLARPGIVAIWAHGNDGMSHRASLTDRAKNLITAPDENGLLAKANQMRLFNAYDAASNAISSVVKGIDHPGDTWDVANLNHAGWVNRALAEAGIIDYRSGRDEKRAARSLKIGKAISDGASKARDIFYGHSASGAIGPDRSAEPLRLAGDVGTPLKDAAGATGWDAAQGGADRPSGARVGDAQQGLDFLVSRRPPSAGVCHAASIGSLADICEDVSQRAHDAVAGALMSQARPGRIAKMVDQAFGHGLKRTRALAEHALTQAHAQATLDALEASGVTHVGTLSEHRRKLRDFDPDEPRDEQGRWTTGGAGYEFVSPNIGNIGFSEAKTALASHRESMLLEASTDVDRAVGAFGVTSAVIGAWADGAEHSTMTVVDHADWDTLRLAAAIKGHLADQKQVLIFKENEPGETPSAMLYSFEAQGDLGAIHQRLLDDGVAFHTLQPKSDGATVWIADTEHSQETAKTVSTAAHGARVDVREGRAEFLGTSQDTGTDREQRNSARRAYEGVIAESPVQGAKALWQGLHHRWGQALAQVTDALRHFNESVNAKVDDALASRAYLSVSESLFDDDDDDVIVEGEGGRRYRVAKRGDEWVVYAADAWLPNDEGNQTRRTVGFVNREALSFEDGAIELWASRYDAARYTGAELDAAVERVYGMPADKVWAALDAARLSPQPKHPKSGKFAKAHVVAREMRRSKRTGRFGKQGLDPVEQRKEELTEARFGRVAGKLDVQTQGDDRVCDVCDEISANGPYTINKARGLIPAHPNCRCLFVAAGTMQDAMSVYLTGLEAWDFDPDQPRNEKGEWSGIVAYHGSPHDFSQFDLAHMGQGEGSQVYGHGLYLAEQPEVAQSYKDPAGGPGGGMLYAVRVHAKPEEFLDWDKPLSQQSKLVQDYVQHRDLGGTLPTGLANRSTAMRWDPSGEQMMRGFVGMGPKGMARLVAAGIKGVRYLDAGSRLFGDAAGMVANYGTREKALEIAQQRLKAASLHDIGYWQKQVDQLGKPQTHNYVVVDPGVLEITHKNGVKLTKAQAKDALDALFDFDPDEPRDPQGRWTALSGSQGHASLISTRPVTAVGKNEEERTAALAARGVYKTIDLAAMKLDPEKFKDNVDLFRDARFYPGMQTSETQARVKTDDLAKVIVERMKSNLKFLVGQQTKAFIKTNKRWYDGAHKLAGRISEDSGIDIASASGVVAALSPQTDWDRNVYMGKAVADSLTHRMDMKWDADMEKVGQAIWTKDNAQFLPMLKGKTLRELSAGADPDAAHALMGMWIRTYDQAHGSRNYHAITAEGDEGDFVRKNAPEGQLGDPKIMMWGTVSSIGNAVAAYRSGGDANKLSDAMGDRHKVRSFYNNILDPDSPNGDVTIDTHAVGAAWMQPYTGHDVSVLHALNTSPEAKHKPEGWKASKGSAVTGVKGTYGLYAQAYREAAADLGLKPRELQSIVWVAKREMFAEDTTGPVMKRNIDAVWRDFHAGKIDIEAAQKQVMKVAKETKDRAK